MVQCPECQKQHINKAGFITTREGKKQKLQCQDCGRIFYEEKEA